MFQHRTFVHIFDQCTQNSRTIVSILKDVFKRLKEQGNINAHRSFPNFLLKTLFNKQNIIF